MQGVSPDEEVVPAVGIFLLPFLATIHCRRDRTSPLWDRELAAMALRHTYSHCWPVEMGRGGHVVWRPKVPHLLHRAPLPKLPSPGLAGIWRHVADSPS